MDSPKRMAVAVLAASMARVIVAAQQVAKQTAGGRFARQSRRAVFFFKIAFRQNAGARRAARIGATTGGVVLGSGGGANGIVHFEKPVKAARFHAIWRLRKQKSYHRGARKTQTKPDRTTQWAPKGKKAAKSRRH